MRWVAVVALQINPANGLLLPGVMDVFQLHFDPIHRSGLAGLATMNQFGRNGLLGCC
jgi:hypothetical protein